MLETGKTAPDFSLPDQDGEIHNLTNYRGQVVLIYFYPMDDTPGCTKEACTIAEMYDDFEKNGVKVFGISADDVASHKRFALKYHLPFTLLSDPERQTIKDYEANEEGEGTEHSTHTKRISYLVSPNGVIIRSYPDVDPATHAGEILKDIGG
ncbi:hypothetical protein A2392_03315 [Candidatus Kaiserbacteria bacterium RIFOXYB1_FULL_46_14]|uniref:thioredoxin-dependent peroxiredoxin n=1 Tax=Candidatus Kaiserbacteria bacterium RIFOXYB1_FULL_46_14 TaxID=1798531 RepID=A0A1F6FI07_9BACT|nr:MAG: hypothetical protein A2392_03315 [Candidatus Kaiserbacteria bacterium RIFOXYB1_FULL_46_14]